MIKFVRLLIWAMRKKWREGNLPILSWEPGSRWLPKYFRELDIAILPIFGLWELSSIKCCLALTLTKELTNSNYLKTSDKSKWLMIAEGYRIKLNSLSKNVYSPTPSPE